MCTLIRVGRRLIPKTKPNLAQASLMSWAGCSSTFSGMTVFISHAATLPGFKDSTTKIYTNVSEHRHHLHYSYGCWDLVTEAPVLGGWPVRAWFSHFHHCLATVLQISREENGEDVARKRPTGKLLFLFLNSLVRGLIGCISAEGSSTIFYLGNNLISHCGHTLERWGSAWLDRHVSYPSPTPQLE